MKTKCNIQVVTVLDALTYCRYTAKPFQCGSFYNDGVGFFLDCNWEMIVMY